MTLAELFATLNRHGLRLQLASDGRLCPMGTHTKDIATIEAAMRNHEPELLALLGVSAPPVAALTLPTKNEAALDPPAPFDGDWRETREVRNGQPIVAFTRPDLDPSEAWWDQYESFDDLPRFPREPGEQTSQAPGGMLLRVASAKPRQPVVRALPGLFDRGSAASFYLLPAEHEAAEKLIAR